MNATTWKDSKWIRFCYQGTTGKTELYYVFAKEGNQFLGMVKWYAPWRKYAFFPQVNSLFESTCLLDITNFLNSLMEERKHKKS